jgi:hypothetical protein
MNEIIKHKVHGFVSGMVYFKYITTLLTLFIGLFIVALTEPNESSARAIMTFGMLSTASVLIGVGSGICFVKEFFSWTNQNWTLLKRHGTVAQSSIALWNKLKIPHAHLGPVVLALTLSLGLMFMAEGRFGTAFLPVYVAATMAITFATKEILLWCSQITR